MDFAAEEELCQQAYEVWLHYACRPAIEGDGPGSGPPIRRTTLAQTSPAVDGPCSVLPLVFSRSGVCYFSDPGAAKAGSTRGRTRPHQQ